MPGVLTPASLSATSACPSGKTVFAAAARSAGRPIEQQHAWSIATPCLWQSVGGVGAEAAQAVLIGQMPVKLRLPAARQIAANFIIGCFTDEAYHPARETGS